MQGHVPLLIGAEAGPQMVQWIAKHADGWLTTPRTSDVADRVTALREAWVEHGRDGQPAVHVLIAHRTSPEDFASWAEAGVLAGPDSESGH